MENLETSGINLIGKSDITKKKKNNLRNTIWKFLKKAK